MSLQEIWNTVYFPKEGRENTPWKFPEKLALQTIASFSMRSIIIWNKAHLTDHTVRVLSHT